MERARERRGEAREEGEGEDVCRGGRERGIEGISMRL